MAKIGAVACRSLCMVHGASGTHSNQPCVFCLQVELERVVAEYKKLEEGLAAAEKEKETLERDRVGCSQGIKQLEKQKAGFEKLLKDLAKHKDSVRRQKEKLEKEVENCKQEITQLEKVRFLSYLSLIHI